MAALLKLYEGTGRRWICKDRIILHFNEKNKNDFKNDSNSWPFDLSKTGRATEPTR